MQEGLEILVNGKPVPYRENPNGSISILGDLEPNTIYEIRYNGPHGGSGGGIDADWSDPIRIPKTKGGFRGNSVSKSPSFSESTVNK